MTFTIEQLEALKEGTPGPWEVGATTALGHVYVGASNPEMGGLVAEVGRFDAPLIASAPDLVDALIAEKRAHAKLRAEIEALIMDCVSSAETFEHNAMTAYSPEACESASTVERDTAEILTRILEGNE